MTTAIAGDLSANNFAGKNLVINGGFQVNQRVYISTTATADGTYMHDRWRSGTADSSYAFSTASPASPQTVTIAANDSIEQVIEGAMVITAGTHTISWTGTATARAVVNTQSMSGNFAISPITVTAVLDQVITMQFCGADAAGGSSIATNTGTLGKVQCELGSVATTFEGRPYGTELALCQRYLEKVGMSLVTTFGGTTDADIAFVWKTGKRIHPSFTLFDTSISLDRVNAGGITSSSSSLTHIGGNIHYRITGYTGLVVKETGVVTQDFAYASAEL